MSMSFEQDKEKMYLEEVLNEIGMWNGNIEEHFYKNGEEITGHVNDEDTVTKSSLYYDEDNILKYEIISNGEKTIIKEFEDGEVVEKFELSSEEIMEALNI